MSFLFDTDAISEVLKRRPLPVYVHWLGNIPRTEQFTSAVTLGELYRGAFRSPRRELHLRYIEERIVPAVTVLPYDQQVARVYGQVAGQLDAHGRRLADADVQIAATALHHDLELVTGNIRHFERVPGLKINRILAEARLL